MLQWRRTGACGANVVMVRGVITQNAATVHVARRSQPCCNYIELVHVAKYVCCNSTAGTRSANERLQQTTSGRCQQTTDHRWRLQTRAMQMLAAHNGTEHRTSSGGTEYSSTNHRVLET